MNSREPNVVLITGASSGIGRELAVEGARRGDCLVLVGRDPVRLAESLALAKQAGKETYGEGHETKAESVVADLTDPVQRKRLIDTIDDTYERLDILFNNAGKVSCGPLSIGLSTELETLFSINVATPAALTMLALPLLRRSDKPRIVNVGSMFGDIAFPRFAAYSATKFALRGLSDALRRELAADGIQVIYAAPRATQTPAASIFSDLIGPMGMKVDAPQRVATRIWKGVDSGRSRLFPGLGERMASIAQALIPGVLDRHLSQIERKIRDASARKTAIYFPTSTQ